MALHLAFVLQDEGAPPAAAASSSSAASSSAVASAPRPSAPLRGRRVLLLSVADGAALRALAFRNFYTHSLRVEAEIPAAASDGRAASASAASPVPQTRWVTVLERRVLMHHAHFEDDAEDEHIVSLRRLSRLAPQPPPGAPLRLKLTLLQPSPLWREIGLRELRCLGRKPRPPREAAEDAAASRSESSDSDSAAESLASPPARH
jgi:hypothetical protein